MNQRGALLVSSYLALVALGIFSVALYSREFTAIRSYERSQNLVQAFHQAESGLDQAIAQLRANLSYAGQGYTAFGSRGGYDIQVEIPDPINNPRLRRVTSTGHTPNNAVASYAYERRQVLAYVDLPPPFVFDFAVFAETGIQLIHNAVTDSYDSSKGPYDPSKPGTHGDVGINGFIDNKGPSLGNITLFHNARVKGDAVAGAGSPIITFHNSVIEGERRVASSKKVLDPVTMPSGCISSGALSVSGNDTLTLGGGTYCYSSVSITGNAKVKFTGPATVYVNGSVVINGNGSVTTAQDLPSNLRINVQGKHVVGLGGHFYGTVYAPETGIAIFGNSTVTGAVVGALIQVAHNAKVHYDEALSKEGGSGSTTQSRVLAWTEV